MKSLINTAMASSRYGHNGRVRGKGTLPLSTAISLLPHCQHQFKSLTLAACGAAIGAASQLCLAHQQDSARQGWACFGLSLMNQHSHPLLAIQGFSHKHFVIAFAKLVNLRQPDLHAIFLQHGIKKQPFCKLQPQLCQPEGHLLADFCKLTAGRLGNCQLTVGQMAAIGSLSNSGRWSSSLREGASLDSN